MSMLSTVQAEHPQLADPFLAVHYSEEFKMHDMVLDAAVIGMLTAFDPVVFCRILLAGAARVVATVIYTFVYTKSTVQAIIVFPALTVTLAAAGVQTLANVDPLVNVTIGFVNLQVENPGDVIFRYNQENQFKANQIVVVGVAQLLVVQKQSALLVLVIHQFAVLHADVKEHSIHKDDTPKLQMSLSQISQENQSIKMKLDNVSDENNRLMAKIQQSVERLNKLNDLARDYKHKFQSAQKTAACKSSSKRSHKKNANQLWTQNLKLCFRRRTSKCLVFIFRFHKKKIKKTCWSKQQSNQLIKRKD